jgi:hypothetical protein
VKAIAIFITLLAVTLPTYGQRQAGNESGPTVEIVTPQHLDSSTTTDSVQHLDFRNRRFDIFDKRGKAILSAKLRNGKYESKWTTEKGDESYTSMVTQRKFKGNMVIKATMEFDPLMAPLIVLAEKLGKSKTGQPEYRNHTEIVIFNEGVNVWVHTWDEKTKSMSFILAAFARFPLKGGTRYVTEVSREGKTLTIKIANQCFGVYLPNLADELHVGLTGCEGHNRFYDFSVVSESLASEKDRWKGTF